MAAVYDSNRIDLRVVAETGAAEGETIISPAAALHARVHRRRKTAPGEVRVWLIISVIVLFFLFSFFFFTLTAIVTVLVLFTGTRFSPHRNDSRRGTSSVRRDRRVRHTLRGRGGLEEKPVTIGEGKRKGGGRRKNEKPNAKRTKTFHTQLSGGL